MYHLTIRPYLFSFRFNQISPFTTFWLAFVFPSRTDTKTLYLAFCHFRLWLIKLSGINYWRLSSYANWVILLINDIIVIYRAVDNVFYTSVQCIHTLVNVIFVYNFLLSQAFQFTPKNIHTLVNVIFVYNCLILQAFLFITDNLLNSSQKQGVSLFSSVIPENKTQLTRWFMETRAE